MKISRIAETQVNHDEMVRALGNIGAKGWHPINAGSGADHLIEFAGKQCYRSFDTALNANLTRANTRDNYDYIQQSIIGQGHGSVLEHAVVTYHVADVSRIVTHELVRHRPGTAFSQESGRYCRVDNLAERFYIPNCIKESSAMLDVFNRAIAQMEENVRELERISDIDNQGFSRKKDLTSAFRRIIGNGQGNDIVVTGNHRMWRHTIAMRTYPAAEEEIRLLFSLIAEDLIRDFPAIYGDCEKRYHHCSDIPHYWLASV